MVWGLGFRLSGAVNCAVGGLGLRVDYRHPTAYTLSPEPQPQALRFKPCWVFRIEVFGLKLSKNSPKQKKALQALSSLKFMIFGFRI